MTTPQKHTPGGNLASAELPKTDPASVPEGDDCAKFTATLIARLALGGFATHRLDRGAFLIARWDRTAYAPDLRAVEAFAKAVGL